MKLETQFLEDHQAKLIVEVEDERLEGMKHRAASKLARRIKIPGFRPGKAPYPVILRNVGEAAVFEEALNMLVDEIYPEAIKEAEIKPYGPGSLENVASTEPLKLEFVVPLDADVKLGDYKAMRKPYEPKPVTEADVEHTLETLRSGQAIIEPVERPAEQGDVVTVLMSGRVVDGDEEQELVKERSFPIIVKSGDEDEWPYPGFSELLIGKSAGDEGSVEHAYPEDYKEESVQGKKAVFQFKVENVKSRTLPGLSDDFAASVGDYATLEDLRNNIRQMLAQQAEQEYNRTYDEEILDQVVEETEFHYPSQMLDDEIHQMIHDLEGQLGRQGLDIDIYMKSRNMDEQALHEEVRPASEKRLKRSLLLYELGRAEDIQVEKEELENEAGSTLNYLQRVLPQKEARRLSNRDVQNNLVNNVLVDLLSRKTVERLRDIASGRLEAQEKAEQEQSAKADDEVEAEAETEAVVETPAPEANAPAEAAPLDETTTEPAEEGEALDEASPSEETGE